MDSQLKKEIAIISELGSSVKLIELGLGELQNLDKNDNYYFLPFQLLSQGFEKLMKCYTCFGYLNQNGNYPPPNYLKKQLGHDLINLLNEICTTYFKNNGHPKLKNDFDFLTESIELRELLFILSEFGKKDRYHNFDIITGSKNDLDSDPETYWRSFEFRLMTNKKGTFEKILDAEWSHEVHSEIMQHIIVIFERFMSSLSRQFLHGCIGETAKQYSSPLFDFALMNETKYGIRDYRKKTTRFEKMPLNVRKRNIIDYFQRKFNPKYKSKTIRKVNYGGEWPFYVDEVVVERRGKYWCVITIDGYDYGLNGSGRSKYRLEFPIDAGASIPGKSVSEFTKIALNL